MCPGGFRIVACVCVMVGVCSLPPVGLYYCFSNLSDARIFIIMYGVTSMYFSAVMVCPAPPEPLPTTPPEPHSK